MKAALLFLLLLPRQSHAQATDLSLSTNTNCSLVSISSYTSTQIVTGQSTTTAPGGQLVVSLQNQNAATGIWCNGSINVSTLPASGVPPANLGWEVLSAGGSSTWTLMRTQPWYCFGGLTTGISVGVLCTEK